MKINPAKEKMKRAIVTLLTKKNFLSITVTDLVKEAGVARATFYRVYSTVNEVVDDVVRDVKNKLVDLMRPVILSKDEEKIKGVIKHLFLLIKESDVPFVNSLPENSAFIISKLEQNNVMFYESSSDDIYEKYTSNIYFVALFTIARLWTKYGYKESIDDIVDYAYSLLYRNNKN